MNAKILKMQSQKVTANTKASQGQMHTLKSTGSRADYCEVLLEETLGLRMGKQDEAYRNSQTQP